MNDFSEYFNMHRSTQPPNMRLTKPAGLFGDAPQNNVFEIKNVGQSGLPGGPQDPLNRGVPNMMQMMPGGQSMCDGRNKLPQANQLQNNQMIQHQQK